LKRCELFVFVVVAAAAAAAAADVVVVVVSYTIVVCQTWPQMKQELDASAMVQHQQESQLDAQNSKPQKKKRCVVQ